MAGFNKIGRSGTRTLFHDEVEIIRHISKNNPQPGQWGYVWTTEHVKVSTDPYDLERKRDAISELTVEMDLEDKFKKLDREE